MAEVPSASGPGGAQGPVIIQPSRGPRRPSMVLGGLLVLIGAILLAGQFVRVEDAKSRDIVITVSSGCRLERSQSRNQLLPVRPLCRRRLTSAGKRTESVYGSVHTNLARPRIEVGELHYVSFEAAFSEAVGT